MRKISAFSNPLSGFGLALIAPVALGTRAATGQTLALGRSHPAAVEEGRP